MRYFIVIILGIILSFGVWYVRYYNAPQFPPPQTLTVSPSPTRTSDTQAIVVAENLDTPWSLVFLPTGEMVVTERFGRVDIVSPGTSKVTPLYTFPSVKELGEGGLLGVALDPKFETNNAIYFYYTYSGSGSTVYNRVVRMTLSNNTLKDEKILVDAIPSSSRHDGGRIKFGPDGYLYVATGDADVPSQAQNKETLNGKILRMTPDGKSAPGNPFGTLIFSYGHRNPQGLTWDESGNLFETEHGRSIPLSGFDEINLIKAGNNYGWPTIQGDEKRSGMQTPLIHSGATGTWAPSGVAFHNGSLFFGGLKGQALYEAVLNGTGVKEIKAHFSGEFGRIRDVVLGPDNMLYVTTSNKDGRGKPTSVDDRIIKINPSLLKK